MTDAFHNKIKVAIQDSQLQEALDANTERRLGAYHKAFDSLPQPFPIMRQRAHALRARTIANLDRYLEEFTANAQANGLVVHRAASAAQAVEIVVDIARRHNAELVAKSKTMVSEEIGLNHALESNGLRAVETDLGEYIVQLREEPPAHIITPAVHLTRSQVGHTFNQKLGLPYTEDVSVMTAAIRGILRETFLNADIGLSGVNFGVAESGTLCIVTNEGNGRMVTTVPPVHIALMGIERLVPTLDDLALVLALLPRAATGQKITVYTTLIHGPRRAGESDGPRERHLILVDNGRSAMRDSPLNDALLCIRCGACLNACPVFREIGGHAYVDTNGRSSTYPGPIGSIVSPALFGQSEFGQLARASSLCGACKEACPVDIDLPKLLLRVRAGGLDLEPESALQKVPASLALSLRIYSWLATSPRRFAAAQKLAAALGLILSPVSNWISLPAFTGWGLSKDFPQPAMRTFRERWTALEASIDPEAPVRPEMSPPAGNTRKQASGDAGNATPVVQDAGIQARLDQFILELTALDGTVALCRRDGSSSLGSADLVDKITAFLQERGVTSLQSWQDEHLPPSLLSALAEMEIQIKHGPDPQAQAGLTGCLAAIAETGTLVIPSGPGRSLTASLLPEIHIAILKAEDIYQNLNQILNLEPVRAAASVALVTGPSRTSDIEMTLTLGVHGPREVHVFCLVNNEGYI
jgi:L-lactate dehydrogenase complex protein LldF